MLLLARQILWNTLFYNKHISKCKECNETILVFNRLIDKLITVFLGELPKYSIQNSCSRNNPVKNIVNSKKNSISAKTFLEYQFKMIWFCIDSIDEFDFNSINHFKFCHTN